MATGQDRRRERLGERLRGAQRTNIEDDSFHLDIAGLNIATSDPTLPPASSARRTPNTSAKRRRLERDEDPTLKPTAIPIPLPVSAQRWSPPPAQDPYGLPETSKESIEPVAVQERESVLEERPSVEDEGSSHGQAATTSPVVGSEEPEEPEEPEEDEMESLPPPIPYQSPTSRRVSRRSDEIEESPRDAPGTGRRRSALMSGALSSSTRLHDALGTDDAAPLSSSPLARKVRRSSVAASVFSARGVRRSPRLSGDGDDDLSVVQARDQSTVSANISELRPIEEESAETTPEQEPVVDLPEEPVADDEAEPTENEMVAEEINAVEAARTIGRKRPRRSPRRHSPELGSNDADEIAQEEPLPKRRRGRQTNTSPAAQKQPAPKPKAKGAARKATSNSTSKKVSKTKAADKARRESNRRESMEDKGASIEITVQRFVNVQKHSQSDNDDDPLSSEVPFSTRGETVVDVFAQVCTEVISSTLQQLQEVSASTEDKAKRKEFRIKMRAIEDYQQELDSKLLQHAIHLNDWHSLRKKVRLAQREKIGLREEIIRLKGEREQVALRMDAVRIKHEEDTKASQYRLDSSAAMHDIDLAIERGRDAPELSLRAQKQAELANLELLVSRISNEASSKSVTGGILQQVKDFNAFLERAAVALESR
ncbi:hypothetical protein BGZ63DRAFT_426498 [Mariannaea sp. PMI_226]|nr:hypothetical protein BGZ63DRAFT_426498 [Mariannaea sp. PMI_226]